MLFTTPSFLIFLVVVFVLYWAVPNRLWQNWVILVASLVFYGSWDWRYLLLLLLIAGTDFMVARSMTEAASPTRKRVLLGISLVTNLGALGFFKYFNFFSRQPARSAEPSRLPGRSIHPPRDPPGWHLFLHVPGAELHHRRLPRPHTRHR